MHTEDEARKRWCPFARTIEQYDDGAVTRPRNRVWTENGAVFCANLAGSQCIASECMAWRWGTEMRRKDGAQTGYSTDFEEVQSDNGHCGLAGEPK